MNLEDRILENQTDDYLGKMLDYNSYQEKQIKLKQWKSANQDTIDKQWAKDFEPYEPDVAEPTTRQKKDNEFEEILRRIKFKKEEAVRERKRAKNSAEYAMNRFMASFFTWADAEVGRVNWTELVGLVESDPTGWAQIDGILEAMESFCIKSDTSNVDLMFYKSKRNSGNTISFENMEKALTVHIYK